MVAGLIAPAIGRDLSLSEAIDLALEHSSGVESARHDSLAAHLDYAASSALRFPEITLTARSSFKDEIPTLDISMPPIQIQRQIGSKETYQADLELTQPLFTGGRLSNSIRAEREMSLAEAAALRAEEMATAFDCRRAYLGAMASAAAVAGTQASLRRLEIIRLDVENLFEVGLADSIDILEAELAVERVRQALAEAMLARAEAMTRLRSLTGFDSSETLILTEPVDPPRKPLPREDASRIQRPELDRLKHVETASDFAVSIARAAYFPSLVGFATYSVGKPNQDLFEDKWNDYLTAGLRLSWGFNTANRTARSAAAAAARARSARAARIDLEDDLEAAHAAALERADYAYENVGRSETQLKLARRRFDLAGERQRVGTLSVNRLLEMEAELTALDRRYQAALVGYYLAEAEYFYTIGSPRVFGGLR